MPHFIFFSSCMHEAIIEREIFITRVNESVIAAGLFISDLQAVCWMYNVTMFVSSWEVGERKHWLGGDTWE